MDYPEYVKVEPYDVEDLYAVILSLVAKVPEGAWTTYGLIAKALGDVIASKAVGEVLARNPRPGRPPSGIPCHRVLYSDGRIGKYAFGSELKRELLSQEGVEIEGDKAVGKPRRPPYVGILSKRAEVQKGIRTAVEDTCSWDVRNFEGSILGLDSAYIKGRLYDHAIAVAVLWKDGKILDAVFTIVPVSVPYIPTYLAYRELQPYVPLARMFPDVDLIAVNGHGLAHPRAGIATHLGYILDKPSVGVAKRLLRNTEAVKIGKYYLSPGYKSAVYPEAIEAVEAADKLTKALRRHILGEG